MRILLLSDSHGSRMQDVLYSLRSGLDVFNICMPGGTISTVQRRVFESMAQIKLFNPDCVLFHVGHNDCAYHPTKCPTPCNGQELCDRMELFVKYVHTHVPFCRKYISCLLPRVPHGFFHADLTRSYNHLSSHASQRFRAMGYNTIFIQMEPISLLQV